MFIQFIEIIFFLTIFIGLFCLISKKVMKD